jgi:hypothetical protein
LEKAIGEFKKQFRTSAGNSLINEVPVAAIEESDIDVTQIVKVKA